MLRLADDTSTACCRPYVSQASVAGLPYGNVADAVGETRRRGDGARFQPEIDGIAAHQSGDAAKHAESAAVAFAGVDRTKVISTPVQPCPG